MRKILLLLIGVVFVFAAEGAPAHTDIIPRTINFLIYAALLWYLVGDKVRKFFQERKERIAKQFQSIDEKLKETKAKKEALKEELAEAKKLAEEIIENAKKEAEYISNKIHDQVDEEIKILQKHFEEFKEAEIKKTKHEAVREFMEEIFKDIHISSEDAAKIILKAA
jgi:F-type H+-transporting ATPase subunit b